MKGLTDEEVINSRRKYGNNSLNIKNTNSFYKLLLQAFNDPIIKILLIALLIKTVVLFKNFDWFETIGILIAVLLSTFISTISEYGSNAAFKRMQADASKSKAIVRRNNQIIEIDADDVVVDDLLIVKSGTKVIADGVIISGELYADLSFINGETAEKHLFPTLNSNESNKVYRGAIINNGEGIVRVTNVGIKTIYGEVIKELGLEKPASPLNIRLTKLAKIISRIGYIGAFLVTLSYLFSVIVINNNYDISLIKMTLWNFPLMAEYLMYALTLAVTVIVVAVPEGLPMMITLVLSSNMKRMIKEQVLVKKLTGIETAGSLNILMTDKTGTLTTGVLTVKEVVLNELGDYQNNKLLKELINYQLFCNNEVIDNGVDLIGGNSTDQAIKKYLGNYQINFKLLSREGFKSINKYAYVNCEINKKIYGFIKGASEVILPKCTQYLDNSGHKKELINDTSIVNMINNYSSKGSRVIALAYKEQKISNHLHDLIFMGLLVIEDQIKKETKEAVQLIDNAGIDILMITGDSLNTAINIARETGIMKEKEFALTSEELKLKSDEEIFQMKGMLKVVARALPSDKSRLVRIFESNGLVVGMTGDGINDAPALKLANVGFAMESGTVVSKDAADIVILDNNLLSIANAVLYGRTIFKSIRKFLVFQLTVNMCALIMSIIGPLIGVTTPITIIQMLWLNMIMDALAGLAFAYEPPLKSYMKELPVKLDEPIINKYMYSEIIFTGLYSAVLCLIFMIIPFVDYKLYVTAYFALFIFIDIFNAFNARTERLNLLANIKKNKVFIIIISFIIITQILIIYFGGDLFRTYGLNIKELSIVILISLTVIPIDFLRKYYIKKRGLNYYV